MHDSMQYEPIQGPVITSPSKLEIWPFPKAVFFAIYKGSLQLTTDS